MEAATTHASQLSGVAKPALETRFRLTTQPDGLVFARFVGDSVLQERDMTRMYKVRALLSLTALILLGVFAVSAATQNGIITINGGRTTVSTQGRIGKVQSRIQPPAPGLVTIYSDLGPAGSEYDCCVGWTVSGAQSPVGANIYSAMAFTPNADYSVARIDIAAGYASGPNGVVVTLNDDQGGVPGNIIHTWRLTNLAAFGTCCTLESLQGGSEAVITGGVQYWIVERALRHDTWDAWNYNDTGATGTGAQKYNGTWAAFPGSTLGAFAVYGVPAN